MANFIHLLVGVILTLTFISLANTNSLPTEPKSNIIVPVGETVVIKVGGKCHTDGDCSGHGHCANETENCECDRGWTTYGNTADVDTYCNYKSLSKKTAFLRSLFAGIFGADWFYLSRANVGYTVAGILKLLLTLGCCVSWLSTYFGPEILNSESVKAKLRGVLACFTLAAIVWWIVDWARILGNRFPDGNGAPLMGW